MKFTRWGKRTGLTLGKSQKKEEKPREGLKSILLFTPGREKKHLRKKGRGLKQANQIGTTPLEIQKGVAKESAKPEGPRL